MPEPDRVTQLREMIAADRTDALAHYLLGVELVRAGDYAAAAEALRRARELQPRHTTTLRMLGDAYRLDGRHAEARDAYAQAIALAEETGDLQVAKEARALLKKLP